MNGQMNRRRVMQLIVALGASAVMHDNVALAAVRDEASPAAGSQCRSSIVGGLDLASARELGREYLAGRPNNEAIGTVAKLLADPANENETLAELRQKVLADFTAGRIVNLSGWFVSETEACVFAVLSHCDT